MPKTIPVKFTKLTALAIFSVLFAGCNAVSSPRDYPGSERPAKVGYTCCNLHVDVDWISDGNFAQYAMIPAGTPITLTGWGRNRVTVEVDGQPLRMGHDYGRNYETLQRFVEKIIVKDNPRNKLNQLAPVTRQAVHEGKVTLGMTREEVIMSLGYPLPSETHTLSSNTWRYYYSMTGDYTVAFNANGVVSRIDARPSIKHFVVLDSGK